MYLKCCKGPNRWFEYFTKNSITTQTLLRRGGILQVQDTTKKEDKKDVKMSRLEKKMNMGEGLSSLLQIVIVIISCLSNKLCDYMC